MLKRVKICSCNIWEWWYKNFDFGTCQNYPARALVLQCWWRTIGNSHQRLHIPVQPSSWSSTTWLTLMEHGGANLDHRQTVMWSRMLWNGNQNLRPIALVSCGTWLLGETDAPQNIIPFRSVSNCFVPLPLHPHRETIQSLSFFEPQSALEADTGWKQGYGCIFAVLRMAFGRISAGLQPNKGIVLTNALIRN